MPDLLEPDHKEIKQRFEPILNKFKTEFFNGQIMAPGFKETKSAVKVEVIGSFDDSESNS